MNRQLIQFRNSARIGRRKASAGTLTVFLPDLYRELQQLTQEQHPLMPPGVPPGRLHPIEFSDESDCLDASTDRPGNGILLAVSGGADSMAMLHALHTLRPQLGQMCLEVAHLNHGLRATESDADAQFVHAACRELGFACHIETLAPDFLQQTSKGSLEEAARKARYHFLLRIARTRRLPFVATAHHQQDQIETILFSLLRGTGLRGLRGMPASRELGDGVRLVRPLLKIPGATLREWLAQRQLAFRNDASNEATDFARNRIRHLLNKLAANKLAANKRACLEDLLMTLGRQAQQTMEVVDQASRRALSASILEATPTIIRIHRNAILTLPEPFVRNGLIELWGQLQWPRQAMNRAHWDRLSEAIRTGKPARWSFPGSVSLQIRKAVATLTRPE